MAILRKKLHAQTPRYTDKNDTHEPSTESTAPIETDDTHSASSDTTNTPSSAQTPDRIITAIEAQKKNPDRLSIYLDGVFAFGLPQALVVQHMLCKGCRIDEEKQRALLVEAQLVRAKEIALNFLSYQSRTEQEVIQKLREREITPDVIEQVIARFRELGYLNDQGFARSFAQSRLEGRGQGPRRIQMELKKRGVAEPHIREAISHLHEQNDLPEAILPHAQKRWERLRKEPHPQKRRQKLLDFLLRQGVGFDLAQKVFHTLQQQDDDAASSTSDIEEQTFFETDAIETFDESPEVFDEPETTERDALEDIRPLALKRWQRLEKSEADPRKRKRKLTDYLRRQGFSFDTISAVLEEIS